MISVQLVYLKVVVLVEISYLGNVVSIQSTYSTMVSRVKVSNLRSVLFQNLKSGSVETLNFTTESIVIVNMSSDFITVSQAFSVVLSL